MTHFIEISGHRFDKSITHLSWPTTEVADMNELKKLSDFPYLTSVIFSRTNLNDSGLLLIAQCETIDNLNLQETEITNNGISHLKNLRRLKYLRLKENTQLDNSCILFLNLCHQLIDLQIHETSINENGLRELNLPGLKDILIDVWENNYSFDFLMDYSAKYSGCTIMVKGKGEFAKGNFTGTWE